VPRQALHAGSLDAAELAERRERVRELAQAIVDGGTMDRSPGSVAASRRRAAD
jgi:hypothetical protein